MRGLDLIIFENDVRTMHRYMQQGISSCMVDLEYMDKDLRQLGFDTDISPGSLDSVKNVSSLPGVTVWCRLNRFGDWTASELEAAIAAGADILVLPMVRSAEEVECFIRLVAGRARICVMLETRQSLELAASIAGMAFEYAYFGLNDYMIDTNGQFLFEPMCDGTVEDVRKLLKNYKFGVAGLTDIEKGSPIPAIEILLELERLKADFVFLRRSFKRDVPLEATGEIFEAIMQQWRLANARSPERRERDQLRWLDYSRPAARERVQ